MGANHGGQGAPKKFYYIIDQKIVQKVDESEAVRADGTFNPGYRKRIKKTNEPVFEREVSWGLSGKIQRIDYRAETPVGPQIEVALRDDGDDTDYVLQIGAVNTNRSFTDNARSLIEQLPYVKFDEQIRLNTYKFTPANSEKSYYGISIFINADGAGKDHSVKSVFKDEIEEVRENFPQAIDKGPDPMTPGKNIYDWLPVSTRVYHDLQAQIQRLIEFKGMVPAAPVSQPVAAPVPATPQPVAAPPQADVTDDLPF